MECWSFLSLTYTRVATTHIFNYSKVLPLVLNLTPKLANSTFKPHTTTFRRLPGGEEENTQGTLPCVSLPEMQFAPARHCHPFPIHDVTNLAPVHLGGDGWASLLACPCAAAVPPVSTAHARQT